VKEVDGRIDGAIYKVAMSEKESSCQTRSLKVLSNARVPLVRENTWVLDPCVPPRRHISYYRLLVAAIRIVTAIWSVLVVLLVGVIVLLGTTSHAAIITRAVGMVGSRVGRRGIRGSAVDTSLVVGRIGGCSTVDNAKGANAIRIHGLATSVNQGVVGMGVGVGSMRW